MSKRGGREQSTLNSTIKFSICFQQVVRTLFFQYFNLEEKQFWQKDGKENSHN
jgi:hypothetical protein